MLQEGDEIDVWVVDRPLGQGGMGSVYRCHNREAKRILAAVKVLDATLGRMPKAKTRFIREAEILFGLDHPGIVKVRNVRMDVDLPYLEMEFVEGENLEARAQLGAMSPDEGIRIFRQVAEALAYLHARGIRHRDIKPSNLVLQATGVVKLVDFGIATEADASTLTEQGQTFGSVPYAPPEWLDPDRLDPVKWDIYAMGVVFYELLTGRQAFPLAGTGTMQQQVIRMMAAKSAHPPLDPGPGFHARLRSLIRDMTQVNPDERIGDAAIVRDRLAAIDLADHEEDPSPAPVPTSSPTWFPDAPSRPPAAATMVPAGGLPPSRPADPTVVLPPPRRTPWLLLGALGLTGLCLLVAVAWVATRPPGPRAVTVLVSGVEAGTPLAVRLGDLAPSAADFPSYRFDAVLPGPARIEAVIGPECTFAADDPAWCLRIGEHREIEAGSGELTLSLVVQPPGERTIDLRAPAVGEAWPLHARVGETVSSGEKGAVLLPASAPGPYAVIAWAGECPEGIMATGSCGGGCPPGCSAWSGIVALPTGDGAFTAEIPLDAPVRPDTSKPERTRPEFPRGNGRVVMAGEFARWLVSHPTWHAEAARAAGQADANYLSGWTGLEPPVGRVRSAMVSVSWAAAAAFCAGRGGLAALDAEPTKWTESKVQPWHEFRSDGGRPAWRRSDGATSKNVRRTESAPAIGFRCAR